jgi:ABC-type multidrug transport system fused ATPase/permease subunit
MAGRKKGLGKTRLVVLIYLGLVLASAISSAISGGLTDPVSIIFTVAVMGVILGFPFLLFHMIYVLVTEKHFKEEWTVEAFKQKRTAKGRAEDSTLDENEDCKALLDEALSCWTLHETVDGDDYVKPKDVKELMSAKEALLDIIKNAPTDADIVAGFNRMAQVVKANAARIFEGSIKLIVIAAAFMVLAFIGLKDAGIRNAIIACLILFVLPIVTYILSSFTPSFLLEQRAAKKSGKGIQALLTGGIMVFAFALLDRALRVNFVTKTTHGDGSVTRSSDGSTNLAWMGINFGITLFLRGIVAASIVIWAVMNYLRNSVLYK